MHSLSPSAGISDEYPFANRDNVSYGVTISPHHNLPDSGDSDHRHHAYPAREGHNHPHSSEDLRRAGTNRASGDELTGSTDNPAEGPPAQAEGDKADANEGIYEQYIAIENQHSMSGAGETTSGTGMEDGTDKPDKVPNEHSTSKEDTNENLKQDRAATNDPYYTIIFDDDTTPTNSTPGSNIAGKVDPYYSIIQNKAGAEEVVYCYSQVGLDKDVKKCPTSGEGYVNRVTLTKYHVTSGYFNVNSGAMETDYVDVDSDAMEMDFQDTVPADYVNVDPGTILTMEHDSVHQDTVPADYANVDPGTILTVEHDSAPADY